MFLFMGSKWFKKRQGIFALPFQNMETLQTIDLYELRQQQNKSQMSALEEELLIIQEQLEKKCKTHDENEIKINILLHQIKEVEELLRKKKNIIEKLVNQLTKVQDELIQNENKSKQQVQNLEEIQGQREIINQQFAQQLQKLEEELKQKEATIEQLVSQLQKVEEELIQKENTNQQLVQQLEEKQGYQFTYQLQVIQEELKQKENTIEKLVNQMTKVQDELIQKENTNQQLVLLLKEIEKQQEIINQQFIFQLKQIQEELKNKENIIEQLSSQLQKVEEELIQNENTNQQLVQQLEENQGQQFAYQLQAIQEELKPKENMIEQLVSQLKKVEEEPTQKEITNQQFVSLLEEIEKQKENINQQFIVQIQTLEEELKQKENTIEQLINQLEDNNSLLKQHQTTINNLQESKSHINKWYATISTELFHKSFLKLLPDNLKINLNTLMKIESITNILKSADLTIHMFDLVDSFNENIDQIPPRYLSLKLNLHYWNYNNQRVTPNNIHQWTTLYHGTSKNFSKQIIENNFKPGTNNYYGGNNCRLTGTTIAFGPGANIYFSSSFAKAEEYGLNKSEFQGKYFTIIFQCKVNPQGYKSPQNRPHYFTVQDNIDIIPEFMLIAPQ